MRTLTILAFDDFVTGTGTNWYTPASYNSEMGACDYLIALAETTNASGTSPTVTCQFEHSGDGRQWLSIATTPEINGASVGSDLIYGGGVAAPFLRFVRIRVSLGGTSPACRLKLFVNGRVSVAQAGGMPGEGAMRLQQLGPR